MYLYGRWKLAFAFGITCVAATGLATLSYLPWRTDFAQQFNNDVYRWYYVGASQAGLPELESWERDWHRLLPHLIELGLLVSYYGFIIAVSTLFRVGRIGSFLLCVAGYALLFWIPNLTKLILWDYDTFLRGIIFDSMSMDLHPLFHWYAGDYSIFSYVFLLIFFATSNAFLFWVRPKRRFLPADCTSANEQPKNSDLSGF